jgi:hypothetical protein
VNKDDIITILKRTVVQLVIITISTVLWLIVWNANALETELKNQLLSILSGVLTGVFLSLTYILFERKFEAELAGESEKRSKESFREVIGEIKKAERVIAESIDNVQLPDNCVYCKFHIKCLKDRDSFDLKQHIEDADTRVWILTTNLHFYSDYLTKIEEAVLRGIDVRLLVLKPTSNFVTLRHKEIGFETAEEFFDQMKVSLKEFVNLRNRLKRCNPEYKFDIKTHLHFPSCMLYILDEMLVFNPILPIGRARNTTYILYDMNQKDAKRMSKNFLDTFTKCWENYAEDADGNYVFNIENLEVWEGSHND